MIAMPHRCGSRVLLSAFARDDLIVGDNGLGRNRAPVPSSLERTQHEFTRLPANLEGIDSDSSDARITAVGDLKVTESRNGYSRRHRPISTGALHYCTEC